MVRGTIGTRLERAQCGGELRGCGHRLDRPTRKQFAPLAAMLSAAGDQRAVTESTPLPPPPFILPVTVSGKLRVKADLPKGPIEFDGPGVVHLVEGDDRSIKLIDGGTFIAVCSAQVSSEARAGKLDRLQAAAAFFGGGVMPQLLARAQKRAAGPVGKPTWEIAVKIGKQRCSARFMLKRDEWTISLLQDRQLLASHTVSVLQSQDAPSAVEGE